jgi:predicted GIY-YIG superfamily endonuclease
MTKNKNYKPRHNKWKNEYERICYIVNGGVYRIRNKLTGRCYYGHSLNLRDRFTKHKDRLAVGKHHNKALQADCDEAGTVEIFAYEPLAATTDKHLGQLLENVLIYEAQEKNLNPYNVYKSNEPKQQIQSSLWEITNKSIKEQN